VRKLTITIAVTLLAVGVGAGAAGGSGQSADVDRALLAQARRATAQFHDVRNAEAAGYLPVSPCEEEHGLGGMGFHYLNPDLVFDGGLLDVTRPEVLLYAPSTNGRLRLVGVEYLVRTEDWTAGSAPDLFGMPFDGPMAEHAPNTTGDHYDQHAWIWSHNPDGVLATWNPALSCTR
jgi:hypothetical protein